MKTAKLFKNGQSQAIRLPKEFRFKGNFVYIQNLGNCVVLVPEGEPWNSMFDSVEKFTSDFMDTRDQGISQTREMLD